MKPLGITMGEPAGIGPELVAKLWQVRCGESLAPFVYIGAPEALQLVAPDIPTHLVANMSEAVTVFSDALPILPIKLRETIVPGVPSPKNGAAVIEAIQTATQLAIEGSIASIVTAPIHKAALYNSGFDAPGHTEYLARLCGENDDFSIMMLTAKNLRAVPVTVHIPLKDVVCSLTAGKIIHAGLVTNHDLKNRFGIKAPRIAVAGLNPHAGEAGTIGMEETTHIMPAIWALRDHGVDVSDPLPADTLFHSEARAAYDAVLCMYHDQALIPVKTLDFWGGVNVTLGLPIIRTSPDHGTALELAGKDIARTDSMLAAVKLAQKMHITTSSQSHA